MPPQRFKNTFHNLILFSKILSIITQAIVLCASFVDFQYLSDHTKKKKFDLGKPLANVQKEEFIVIIVLAFTFAINRHTFHKVWKSTEGNLHYNSRKKSKELNLNSSKINSCAPRSGLFKYYILVSVSWIIHYIPKAQYRWNHYVIKVKRCFDIWFNTV